MPTPLGVENFPNSADVVDPATACQALEVLRGFRTSLYAACTARGDALFEVTDALLCADGAVSTLVGLCLAPEHRRGHGALYDALNAGAIDIGTLRTALARLPLPRLGGRVVLAVDASPWLRPDAATAPDRCFCHVYGRGRGADQRIPGWPYQFIVALEAGPTSWTAPLDVVRLGPDDDATEVTADQLRAVVDRLITAGHWRAGDPAVVVVMDSGYDVTRLAFALADLPVLLVGRVRADRVFLTQVPARQQGAVGRPRRHGAPVWLAEPTSWPTPSTTTTTTSARYGQVQVTSFDHLHPRLARRGSWAEHAGDLPIVAGTVVRLAVQRLPGARTSGPGQQVPPVWLWTSRATSDAEAVTTAWSAYLRRFDEEHTFRFLKQTLGWTCPQIRDPAAGDRWTWLVVAAYTQLRLARPLAGDLRRPWERPAPTAALSPARVRRGFRYLRAKTGSPARAPKPSRPGPGRPPGVKNRHHATVHRVGKHDAVPATASSPG